MRIVVISDSHGNSRALERIVLEQPNADCFVHLGDGQREFAGLAAAFPDRKMLGVRGNCDIGTDGGTIGLLRAGGHTIFFAHGHTFRVKHSFDALIRAARSADADIALFGHTHTALRTYEDGLYLMNPGSAGCPRGEPASYGIVDLTEAGVVLNLIRLERGRGWK